MTKANATFIFMLAAICALGVQATRNDKSPGTYGTNYDNAFGKVRKSPDNIREVLEGRGIFNSPTKITKVDATNGLVAGNKVTMMNGKVEAIFGVNAQELGRRGFTVTQTATTTKMETVQKDGKMYMVTTVRDGNDQLVSRKEELIGRVLESPNKYTPTDYSKKPIFGNDKATISPDKKKQGYFDPFADTKKDEKDAYRYVPSPGTNGQYTYTTTKATYSSPTDFKAKENTGTVPATNGLTKDTTSLDKNDANLGKDYTKGPNTYNYGYGNEPKKVYDLPKDVYGTRGKDTVGTTTYETTKNYGVYNGVQDKYAPNNSPDHIKKPDVIPEYKKIFPDTDKIGLKNNGQMPKEFVKVEVKKDDPVQKNPNTGKQPEKLNPNLPNVDVNAMQGKIGILKKPEAVVRDNSSPPKTTGNENLKVAIANLPNTAEVLNNQGKGTKQPPTRPNMGTKKPPTLPEREQKTNTGSQGIPAGFYTKTRHTQAGYVPLNIKWELGPVKDFCEKNKMMEYYPLLKKLLHKAAAVLRMYIHVPENMDRKVVVESKTYCGDFYYPETRIYDAHVVMFGRIFHPDKENQSTIASSMFCTKDDNNRNRAITGSINFSSTKMIKESDTPVKKWDYVFTIVHEVLHTLAFHYDSERVLVKKEVAPEHKMLTLIKKLNPRIYDSGHWLEDKIVNDLMGPISRINSIWSSITAELIAHTSPDFTANNKDLVFNTFLESVSDVESFFKYQCTDNKPSPYAFMCSQIDRTNMKNSCSVDYLFMTKCDNTKYTNNCYKVVPYSNGSCKEPRKGEKGSVFEFHGPNARCFEVDNENGSMCLQYEIQGKNVAVVLGKSKAICTPNDSGKSKSATHEISRRETREGTEIVSTSITIVCPDVEKFIKFAQRTSCPDDCNQNGFCSNGKCICLDGYDAADNCKKDTEIALNENMFSEYSKITLTQVVPR